ncbi:MAG: (Fe-S)-binding protein, partial [Geminicoccaceae bacterium]|nr:(Fe-S)-binding protein [Geminicoccaceae bacterium]
AGQTCCGQPAYNSGDRASTVAIARGAIEALEPHDYVVVPSGSCAGMLKKHYPALFDPGDPFLGRAEALAAKTYELISFLVDVRGMETVDASFEGVVTYHDSCSGLRELGVKRQPRRLLASVRGLQLTELDGAEVCCGFGGTFCVKYPEISTRMVSDKAADLESTEADLVLAGDLGCLMNIAGRLKRTGSRIEARHVAEVLAGETAGPPIGAPRA